MLIDEEWIVRCDGINHLYTEWYTRSPFLYRYIRGWWKMR
jgi:hypothetical protein